MKRLFCLTVVLYSLCASSQAIYDFKVKNEVGEEVALSDFRGQLLLIVNTATRCGFTPQYDELEALYEKYHDQGLEILDFPCNQFGEQAPGSIQDIHNFCVAKFNIHFPQFDKVDVNGSYAHPLFTYLKTQKTFTGFNQDDELGRVLHKMMSKQDPDYAKSPDIKWNFTKFLVSRDGRVLHRYEPTDRLSDVETDIQLELNPTLSVIMARRSIRKYQERPVEHEKLQLIAHCGINAPSAMNRQPWVVRVVEDQMLIAEISDVYRKANSKQVERDKDFRNMFRNAPNLICVCTPRDGSGQLDAGLLGQNMMLAAEAIGLGTCCLGGPVRWLNSFEGAAFFLQRLKIPTDYQLSYILAVGYPDEQPDARPRDAAKVDYVR